MSDAGAPTAEEIRKLWKEHRAKWIFRDWKTMTLPFVRQRNLFPLTEMAPSPEAGMLHLLVFEKCFRRLEDGSTLIVIMCNGIQLEIDEWRPSW